jgi:hypothetical protein
MANTTDTYFDTLSRTPEMQRGMLGGAYADMSPRFRDVVGRQKMSRHQNIYDADFEYGKQPLRWEEFTTTGGTITHMPGLGGVKMSVTSASGAITIRQSRPYHRYQPGKTMFMATALNFGVANLNQVQRVGFMDDSNGVLFQQDPPTTTNPYGMYVVVRSDTSGVVTDTRIGIESWNGNPQAIASIDWTRIQMVWIEYAWYGAGATRWGVFIDGEPYILHQIGFGNRASQTSPWARTGNLPVRYEQRNTGASTANDMYHYGVSVLVEGGIDEQRGFTYSYGMAPASPRRAVSAASTRYPVLSIRPRVMGLSEYTQASSAITAGTTTTLTATGTPWTVNQWQGRMLHLPSLNLVARITSNTTSVLTFENIVTGLALASAPTAGINYTIGLIDRGQLLPKRLMLSSDALCVVELIASTPTSPVALTGASFVGLASLGSPNSFAERDISATALSGGEVVFAFTAPAGGSGLQDIDLSYFFPILNTIQGATPDVLTVAITTQSGTAANVGAHLICQEAMS